MSLDEVSRKTAVHEIRYEKGRTERAGDCFFSHLKKKRVLNWRNVRLHEGIRSALIDHNLLEMGYHTVQDLPLLLCCSDALIAAGDPLPGRPVWFTELHLVLVIFLSTYVLLIHFIFYIKQCSAIPNKTTIPFPTN